MNEYQKIINKFKISEKIEEINYAVGCLVLWQSKFCDGKDISRIRQKKIDSCQKLCSYAKTKGDDAWSRVFYTTRFIELVIENEPQWMLDRTISVGVPCILENYAILRRLSKEQEFVMGLVSLFHMYYDKKYQQNLLSIKEEFLKLYDLTAAENRESQVERRAALATMVLPPQPYSYAQLAFAAFGVSLFIILAQKWLND